MTYAANQKILANDYNGLLGTGTEANALNTVWASGTSRAGYGQTALTTVISPAKVAAAPWATLVSRVNSIASHQGSAITAVTAPASGGKVVALSAIPVNLTTIYNNRNNAAGQGTTYSLPVATQTTWGDRIVYTFVVSFPSGDAARYYFNAGGQIAFTFSHGTTTAGINALLNSLCSAMGTVAFSAPSSGTVNIAGTNYAGVTKVGGSGSAAAFSANAGYYAMNTSPQTIIKQLADPASSLTKYVGTFIQIDAKSNGTQGSKGDMGNILTFTVTIDEVSTQTSGLTVATGTTATLTMRPPSTTYLTNTWGILPGNPSNTITVTGSVSGS